MKHLSSTQKTWRHCDLICGLWSGTEMRCCSRLFSVIPEYVWCLMAARSRHVHSWPMLEASLLEVPVANTSLLWQLFFFGGVLGLKIAQTLPHLSLKRLLLWVYQGNPCQKMPWIMPSGTTSRQNRPFPTFLRLVIMVAFLAWAASTPWKAICCW